MISQKYYDKIENLLEDGRSLYQGGHFESVGLHETCKYLEDIYKKTTKQHEQRKNQLVIGREFHQLIIEVKNGLLTVLIVC